MDNTYNTRFEVAEAILRKLEEGGGGGSVPTNVLKCVTMSTDEYQALAVKDRYTVYIVSDAIDNGSEDDGNVTDNLYTVNLLGITTDVFPSRDQVIDSAVNDEFVLYVIFDTEYTCFTLYGGVVLFQDENGDMVNCLLVNNYDGNPIKVSYATSNMQYGLNPQGFCRVWNPEYPDDDEHKITESDFGWAFSE